MRVGLPVAVPALSRCNSAPDSPSAMMKAYMCVICGYVYEEVKGDPNANLPPGTKWEDVPLSWRCPDCGAGKEDFEMIEI
jgi:rubredoxin